MSLLNQQKLHLSNLQNERKDLITFYNNLNFKEHPS